MAGTSLRVLPFERWPGRRVMFWRTHNIGVTRFAITTIWSGDSIAGIAWLVRIGAGAAAGAIHTGMAMAPQALRRMLPVLRQPGHRLPGLQFPVLFTGPAQRSAEALRSDTTLELVAMDLRIAVNAVGEIVGKTATEDLLDSIFDQFCIGK